MKHYYGLELTLQRLFIPVLIFLFGFMDTNASVYSEEFTSGNFKYIITYSVDGGGNTTYSYDSGFVAGVADGVTLQGNVTIPSQVSFKDRMLTVKYINDGAFMNQTGIESVEFGPDIEGVYINAFKGCTGLKTLSVPSHITSIGISAFEGCSLLQEVNFLSDTQVPQSDQNQLEMHISAFTDTPVTTLNLGRHIFVSRSATDKQAIFPDLVSWSIQPNVSLIPGFIFYENQNLTEFTVPASITEIGDYAFTGCGNLSKVTLSDNLGKIGTEAFANCALQSLTLPAYLSSIGNNAFTGMPSLNEIKILPSKLETEITLNLNKVFDSPSNIIRLEIGRNITLSEKCPWPNVTEVVLNEGLTVIDGYMLSGCSKVAELTLPQSLTTINLLNLPITTLSIPGNVVEIGNDAISLPNLKTLTFEQGDAPIHIGHITTTPAKGMFVNCHDLTDLHVYRDIKYDYYTGFAGTNYDKQLFAPFRNMNHLMKAFFSPDVTFLDPEMFNDDKYTGGSCLTRVALPEGLDVKGDPYDKIIYPRDCVIEHGPVVYSKDKDILYYVDQHYEGMLELPAGLRIVGESAAHGAVDLSIKSLPAGLESIGRAAFRYCRSLGIDEWECPATLVSVGEEAFLDAGIKTLTVNESLAEIGSRAFGSPSNVVYKARNAAFIPYKGNNDVTLFNSFKSMSIEEGVESLPDWFAAYSSGEITFPSTLKRVGNYAFYYGGYSSLKLPESVESIGEHAFELCRNLKELDLPEAMTEIPAASFAKCTSLATINIPANIVCIAEDAFDGCTAVTNINVEAGPEPLVSTALNTKPLCPSKQLLRVSLGRDYLLSTGNPQLIWKDKAPVSFVIGEKVTNLSSQNSLTPVKTFWNVAATPANYKKYQGSAVNYVRAAGISGGQDEEVCRWLSSMFEDNGIIYVLTSASAAAAIDCSYSPSVVTVDVPAAVMGPRGSEVEVTELKPYLFYANPYLTDVNLLRGGDIGRYAFAQCVALETVSAEHKIDNIGDNAFNGCSVLKSFSAPQGVTKVGNLSFYDCRSLISAQLPDVTEVGNQAFSGCSSLTSFTFPASLTSVGMAVFANCSSLAEVDFDNCAIQSLPVQFFMNCTSLREIRIPASVISFTGTTFQGCTGVEAIIVESHEDVFAFPDESKYSTLFSEIPFQSVTLHADVTLPSNNPFSDKSSLIQVVLGDKVTKVHSGMFSNNTNLTDVTMGKNVTEVGDRAFSGCSALTKLNFGESVRTIGAGCAANSGLSEVRIGAKTEKIGAEAFGSNPLDAVYCYAAVPPVCGDKTFNGVDTFNCTLNVPEASVDAYRTAPQWEDFFDIKGLKDDEIGTGITSPDDAEGSAEDVKIQSTDDGMILTGCRGQHVMVLTVSGQMVFESAAAQGDVRISLPEGVYILRIGTCSMKVMI